MAEAIIGAALGKVVSLAAEEISLTWGVDEQLKKLAEKLEMIQALLCDAQNNQSTSKAVQLWLKKLWSIALDADIVLDEFGYELLRQKIEGRETDKVRRFFSSSNPLSFRLQMAHKIKNVISSLEQVYTEANEIGLRPVELITALFPDLKEERLTDPFVVDSEIVGRDDDASMVISMLISSDYEMDLPVITILGMAGQGKTTLAKLVYNNDKIKNHFDERVWLCVSDDFNVEKLLAEMVQSLIQTNCQLTNREALVKTLKEHLRDKKYLLVLDDVWNENRDKWDCIRRCLLEISGHKGSKILATTRNEEVASTMRTSRYHWLQILSDDQSWTLFENCAFVEGGATKTSQLVDIGKRILKRCGGVPLAIKAIGGSLYSKNCEWEWLMIERSEIWSSSDRGDGVLSAIKLSYDHLPSLSLKQCFAYCAIFQKDTCIYKDKLIQLWMAQGLVNPPKGSHLQIEDIGSNYFNILLRSSLLQDPEKDFHDNITSCKMHDLVHDFSLQQSENYCFHMKDGKIVNKDIEVMHLSIISGERKMWKNLKGIVLLKLQTLHLECVGLLKDLWANCRRLCVLIVEDWDVKELPNAIGEMKHLRYLDISCTYIETLPKSITKLYNLQTLRVCYLKEFPKGFQNLINLRHLYVKSFFAYKANCLLPEIGQLTNLQTLPFFEVTQCQGCQIEELEHLHNLKGELRIFGLQNVSSYESAAKSNLSIKLNIQALELHWANRFNDCDCDDTDVMEGLKPHLNLKGLKIVGYLSSKFPSWMTANNGLLLLRNLVDVKLEGLDCCEQLPAFGDLPCLRHLYIIRLHIVRYIGKEFYGWSNIDRASKNNCSKKAEMVVFPALRILELGNMNSVVEWSDAIIPSHSPLEAFPYLERMDIVGLPNLSVLPNLGSLSVLKRLTIKHCKSLACLWNLSSLTSLQSLEIKHCPSLTSLPVDSEGQHGLRSLEELNLSSCPNLVISPGEHDLQSLCHLCIKNCDKLMTAPFFSFKTLTAIVGLKLKFNPCLWPKNLCQLTNLRALRLGGGGYYDLDCFPCPYSSNAMSASEDADDVQHFVSLKSLKLVGWPKATSISDQFQYLTSLRHLEIWYFDWLEVLPEWLGNLECLQNLKVIGCYNLKELPSAEAFQRLTNLQYLTINNCPLLKERCTQGTGSEWPKIAHLPKFQTNVSCSLFQFIPTICHEERHLYSMSSNSSSLPHCLCMYRSSKLVAVRIARS